MSLDHVIITNDKYSMLIDLKMLTTNSGFLSNNCIFVYSYILKVIVQSHLFNAT